MRNRLLATFLAATSAVTPVVRAQAPGRIATTVQNLLAYPVFFHGKQIVVRTAVRNTGDLTRVDTGAVPDPANTPAHPHAIFVFWRDVPSRDSGELRGEFWDLGRLREDDSRFSSYDFRRLLEVATGGRWPGRDEVFVIVGATLVEAPLPPSPTVRAVALTPDQYVDRNVTVVGRFRGRNLYGDLPAPLNRTRWDFVLQSADGAIWVSGLRPRGKGFDLDAGARADTGRWLEVTGTVRTEGSNTWIDAQSLRLASAPSETTVDIVVPPPVQEPAPQVVFSAPVQDDTDVERGTTVRVQFSRDMDGRTLRDRVRVSYTSPARGPTPEPPNFSATYHEGNRALEIKFARPLDRFQTVKVELLDGIAATDGQPLKPWALTFTTGA